MVPSRHGHPDDDVDDEQQCAQRAPHARRGVFNRARDPNHEPGSDRGSVRVAAENCVVIDSRAEYVDAEGESSQVASCDIYDSIDGSLAAITTYAVEIDSSAAD